VSRHERNGGRRELTYSHWHREEQIKAFLTPYQAQYLYMSDVDDLELCPFCYHPIAAIETTRYRGMFRKDATSTRNLAADAGFPSFTVYYLADEPPICPCCQMWTPPWPDIEAFYVSGPLPSDDLPTYMVPAEYADFLRDLRILHSPRCAETQDWRRKNWKLWAAQP
jgi:hypothetical protein